MISASRGRNRRHGSKMVRAACFCCCYSIFTMRKSPLFLGDQLGFLQYDHHNRNQHQLQNNAGDGA